MSRPDVIDLSKGWPAASLLPTNTLLRASHAVLTDPSLFVPALSYGDDAGYEPLRVAIAQWLQSFYSAHWTTMNRICISGGASTALACVLQVYTDPIYTQTVFMIAPAYFLACTIFEDNGFTGKFRDVPEDAEGIDIEYLEQCLVVQEITNKTGARQVCYNIIFSRTGS
jgi:DNA-binding transcriptional MocR family regulator